MDDAGKPPELSDSALLAWSTTRQREHFKIVAQATPESRLLSVDGVLHEFAVTLVEGCWAATGTVDGKLVTVTARNIPIESVSLHTLSTPPLRAR